MRHQFFLLLILFCATSLHGQASNDNPFEIQSDREQQQTQRQPRVQRPDNPFEVASPVAVESPTDEAAFENTDGPLLIRRDSDPAVLDARGRTLGIHILLLVFLALSWIFFRQLLARCYAALFNEGLFNQLYRDRKNGKLGLFIFPYLLFFAAGGFYVYLAGQVLEFFPSDQAWAYWQRLSLGIAAYYLGKQLLLAVLGWIFSLEKESSQYSFMIMIFAIVTGMFFIPASLLLSYAPASTTKVILYCSIIVLVLIYLLRAVRALLINSRLMSSGPLHFLLYICAVELAPLLILYRIFAG